MQYDDLDDDGVWSWCSRNSRRGTSRGGFPHFEKVGKHWDSLERMKLLNISRTLERGDWERKEQ